MLKTPCSHSTRFEAELIPPDPLGFFARWSAEDAAWLWRVDLLYGISGKRHRRCTIGAASRVSDTVEVLERWTARELVVELDGREVRRSANPYPFIPFVQVASLPQPNEQWGVSDLRDVMGLHRAYNERLSDHADTIRSHADPPVIFKGLSEHTDLAVGPGTVWDLPAAADVSLLEWRRTAPAVEEHLDRLLQAIYEVSETPRTAFRDSGRLLSGVALETEPRPLIQKTLRRWVDWGRRCRQVVVDAKGVGGGLAAFPGAALGEHLVLPYVYTAATKSKLGYDLLAAINADRLNWFRPTPETPDWYEFFEQAGAATYELRANQVMRWGVPEGRGHDDLLNAAALMVQAGPVSGVRVASGRQGVASA